MRTFDALSEAGYFVCSPAVCGFGGHSSGIDGECNFYELGRGWKALLGVSSGELRTVASAEAAVENFTNSQFWSGQISDFGSFSIKNQRKCKKNAEKLMY
jgi:hypothetical protein